MEQADDGFLKVFLLNMCAPRIMVLLVPVYFMFIQEILIEGFVSKKNFSSYSFVEAALEMRFCGISESFFWIFFYKLLVVSKGKCTTKPQFLLRNIPISSSLTDRPLFLKKFFCSVFTKPFSKKN